MRFITEVSSARTFVQWAARFRAFMGRRATLRRASELFQQHLMDEGIAIDPSPR